MVQGEEPHNLSPIVVRHPVLQLLQHSPARKHKPGQCPNQEEPQNTGWQHDYELIAKFIGTNILKTLAGTTVVKDKKPYSLPTEHSASHSSIIEHLSGSQPSARPT